MGVKRQARESALQILYPLDGKTIPTLDDAESAAERFFDNFEAPDRSREHATSVIRGVIATRDVLDARIQRHSPRWKVERMAMVDRNILRLLSYELEHDVDTPARSLISEGIEIAKRFGAEESARFVNGVLDGVARELGRLPARGPGAP
jgi:transcription antitermination protein NusB